MQSQAVISDLRPADVARRLGISRSYAFELIKRVKTPSLDVAVRIEQEFGVPASDWMKPGTPAKQSEPSNTTRAA